MKAYRSGIGTEDTQKKVKEFSSKTYTSPSVCSWDSCLCFRPWLITVVAYWNIFVSWFNQDTYKVEPASQTSNSHFMVSQCLFLPTGALGEGVHYHLPNWPWINILTFSILTLSKIPEESFLYTKRSVFLRGIRNLVIFEWGRVLAQKWWWLGELAP